MHIHPSLKKFLSVPWKRLKVLAVCLGVLALLYMLWSPGEAKAPEGHQAAAHGMWLQHGWIGDDAWFERYNKQSQRSTFRGSQALGKLATQLNEHHIKDVFPHLAPCSEQGALLKPDPEQIELFLDVMNSERVMPWIGGVYQRDVHANLPMWRERFIGDVIDLLKRHDRLAGVHVNIEPWPSGEPHLLTLLEELRARLPEGKILSVAAYPPPVPIVGNLTVHWTPEYIRQVAQRVDHMAFMNYDSGLKLEKLYVALMDLWVRQELEATQHTATQVLLGLPVYDDAGVPWHDPDVEHLDSSLEGSFGGLHGLPEEQRIHYQGCPFTRTGRWINPNGRDGDQRSMPSKSLTEVA